MRQFTRTHRAVAVAAALAGALLAPASGLARIPEPQAWQPLPLGMRLLQPGELMDLVPVAPAEPLAPQRLPEGATAALIERLASPTGDVRATSIVMAFGTPQDAEAQARRWRSVSESSSRVEFADGDFAYLGAITSPQSSLHARLVAAMNDVRRRVSGHPAD
jgi:hypothetical protein